MEREERKGPDSHSGSSEGSDVIECVVQLLADGLVLQFLSIQLVYEQEVEGRDARTMENGQEMEGEQGWRGRHPHAAARKGQCMKGLVPQQMANAGGVRFVFKEIETKTKRTKTH